MASANFERSMKLAAVSGLRAALGPALVAAALNRPERKVLALAAMAEMVIDKLPLMPSRANLALMIPRAMAGAWVAKTLNEEEGEVHDPWAPVMGAVVAAGVSVLAPRVRSLVGVAVGVHSPLVGLAEDYLALRIGGEAAGFSMEDLKQIGMETIGEAREIVGPAVDQVRAVGHQVAQSAGAGSM